MQLSAYRKSIYSLALILLLVYSLVYIQVETPLGRAIQSLPAGQASRVARLHDNVVVQFGYRLLLLVINNGLLYYYLKLGTWLAWRKKADGLDKARYQIALSNLFWSVFAINHILGISLQIVITCFTQEHMSLLSAWVGRGYQLCLMSLVISLAYMPYVKATGNWPLLVLYVLFEMSLLGVGLCL